MKCIPSNTVRLYTILYTYVYILIGALKKFIIIQILHNQSLIKSGQKCSNLEWWFISSVHLDEHLNGLKGLMNKVSIQVSQLAQRTCNSFVIIISCSYIFATYLTEPSSTSVWQKPKAFEQTVFQEIAH